MKSTRELYLIHACAQMFDWATTYAVIKLDNGKGRAEEANPFLRSFVKNGRWKTLFAIKCGAVFVPALLHRKLKHSDPELYKQEVRTSLRFSSVFTGIVAFNNAKIALRLAVRNIREKE